MSQAHTTRYTLSADALAALEAGDPAALIGAHRPIFGGFTMEDTGDTGADTTTGDTGNDDGADTGNDDTNLDDANDDGTDDERVKRANRQAANYRTQLRESQQQVQTLTEQQAEQGQILERLRAAITGESGESAETDPTEALAAITGERDTLRDQVTELTAELLVHTLAGDNGANPVALLDSRDFTRTLHGLDPAAEDYREQVSQAIATAVEKNDRYAAQGQGPSRGGTDVSGQGSRTAGTVTQEQFNAMSYRDKTDLHRTNPALYRQLSGTA